MPTVRRIPRPEDAPEPAEEQLELPVDVPSKPKRLRQGPRKSKNGNGANLNYVLTPGSYVGAATAEEEAEPFEEKIQRLNQQLEYQFAESERLTKVIRESLGRVEYTEVDSQVEQ